MPATIILFPRAARLPRTAIAATIERLIDLLDLEDVMKAELEPDENEEDGGDDEPGNWPEWHTRRDISFGCCSAGRC